MEDVRTAKNSTWGKAFNSLCYTADGTALLAGGNSKYVCIYDVRSRILLKKFQTSHNRSLDGVLDFLNSKDMTAAGPLSLIDDKEPDEPAKCVLSTSASLLRSCAAYTGTKTCPAFGRTASRRCQLCGRSTSSFPRRPAPGRPPPRRFVAPFLSRLALVPGCLRE